MSEFRERPQFKFPGAAFAFSLAILCAIAIPFTVGYGQGKKTDKPVKTASANWEAFGRDISGSHYNPDETKLTPASVTQLKPKWIFNTEGDVSSQPLLI